MVPESKDVRRALCAGNNLTLYDRYELLELRRDDGIQTFHAREVATARPVQFHLFAQDESRENLALLSRLDHLPDAERRRVIERGEYQGRPYVITDRLAGYPGFREWLTVRSRLPVRNSSLDEQFLQLFDSPWDHAKAAAPAIARPDTQELDRQFFQLFHPDADLDAGTLWLTASLPAATEPQPARPVRSAARSLLGIVLGIVAAILVLGLLVAVVAFRPW